MVDVSVIITTYNQSRTLPLVLRLLAEQSYPGPWELIVCDDGSDDDPLSVVKDVLAGVPFDVRYVWQARRGERRARSRNNGLSCAKGRIVIFLDGDIGVGRRFVEEHVNAHRGGSTMVCGTRRWLFLRDLEPNVSLDEHVRWLLTKPTRVVGMYSECAFQDVYKGTPYAWLGCMTSNCSFTRDGEDVRLDEAFEGWGSEDQEFACRLQTRHFYNLSFSRSLYGIHLVDESSDAFLPVRPQTPDAIHGYLRNVIYFAGKYPELDMTAACNGLAFFEFDEESGFWALSKSPNIQPREIQKKMRTAKDWLARANPQPAVSL